MNARLFAGTIGVAVVTVALCVTLAVRAEPPGGASESSKKNPKAFSDREVDREQRISLAAARDRAKLMHEIYDSTLEVLHRHYFRREGSVLPARAMEDIFDDMTRQSGIQARWISVNTKPMSIHHEPESEFEKQAAKELAGGKDAFEQVEKGYYQRAGRISLGGGCLSCHTNQFTSPSTSPKFAGLVIRIPIEAE